MASYYTLSITQSLNIVGHYPQVMGVMGPKSNDFSPITELDHFPSEIPFGQGFTLHPRAELTDMMSSLWIAPPQGFLVSKPLEFLLSRFELHKTRFYDVKVLNNRPLNNSITPHYQQTIVLESMEMIDFNGSVFTEIDFSGQKTGVEHFFGSAADFAEEDQQAIVNRSQTLYPQSIRLLRDFDLFRLPRLEHLLISQNLKRALEKQRITGIEIATSTVEFY